MNVANVHMTRKSGHRVTDLLTNAPAPRHLEQVSGALGVPGLRRRRCLCEGFDLRGVQVAFAVADDAAVLAVGGATALCLLPLEPADGYAQVGGGFAGDTDFLILGVLGGASESTARRAPSQDAHWCLVSVQVPRADFERLDLTRVDPMDCLAYLHAEVSKTPEKYQPVQPIIDYPWDDLHYAEELDAAAGLDSVQNLLDLDGYEFEQLLVKLCQEIPEFDEVRRTRSRADGGINLVAVNKTPFVGGRVAIQAKRYAPHNKVDIAAVREIIGSISQREFTKGIIITTSGFTSAARQEAERLGVELYDGERLLWLLRHLLHRDFNIIDQSRRKPPFRKLPGPATAP